MDSVALSIEAVARIQHEIKSRLTLLTTVVEAALLYLFCLPAVNKTIISNLEFSLSSHLLRLLVFVTLLYVIYIVPHLIAREYEKIAVDESFSLSPHSAREWFSVFIITSIVKLLLLLGFVSILYTIILFSPNLWFVYLSVFGGILILLFLLLKASLMRLIVYEKSELRDTTLFEMLSDLVHSYGLKLNRVVIWKKRHLFSGHTRHIELAAHKPHKYTLYLSEEMISALTKHELALMLDRELASFTKNYHLITALAESILFGFFIFLTSFLYIKLSSVLGFVSLLDLASLPVFCLLAFLIWHISVPLRNLPKKIMVRMADKHLALNNMVAAFSTVLQKLAVSDLKDYSPHILYELFFMNNIPLKKRIAYIRNTSTND